MTSLLVFAALAILPSDRLAMADRLFNRGDYRGALGEYRALEGERTIAPDELLHRRAECLRGLGEKAEAAKAYAELYGKHPSSKHADSARLNSALLAEGAERTRLLKTLDSDRVEKTIRAAALYYLGADASDAALLERCVKTDPKGRYAEYATMRRGTLLVASANDSDRRKGAELLFSLSFSSSPLAEEALYLAAAYTYRDKRYSEALALTKRYQRLFKAGKHGGEMRVIEIWCDYLAGRYADAIAVIGDAKDEDALYVKALASQALADPAAVTMYSAYLDGFPEGRYRKDAELQLARLEFSAAAKGGDKAKSLEAAKRAAKSGRADDRLRLAWAYERVGETALAEREYDGIASSAADPETRADALYSKAMISARARDWNRTELALAEALATGKLGGRETSALYWRGVAAWELKHREEAVKHLEKALKGQLAIDERREARLLLADFELERGERDKAKKAYAELLREGSAERISSARLYELGKLFAPSKESKICAEALIAGESAEWRQLGGVLLGLNLEREEAYTAAIAAYRKAFETKSGRLPADAAKGLVALGKLETRAGDFERAEATLKRAVAENAHDHKVRAEAYLALARNAEAKGDAKGACGYATVVTALFDEKETVAEAEKILKAHQGAGR